MNNSFKSSSALKLLFTCFLFITLQACGNKGNSKKDGTADTETPKLEQLYQGLHGYISMNLPKQKAGFGYGVSFYVTAWPLLEKPLSNFQIGLPGTWISPDNRNFEEPLCPPGTYARDNWESMRGPSFRDVFQTIEGSLGFWGSTQFGSTTAKYRMNGTTNCYNSEISSPGWGFGNPKPLASDEMGMAQLSNHLIIPPDGVTFLEGTSGEVMGNAWMALPLIPAQPKKDGSAPSGDQSWTCFLNATNFKGPIAFYIPHAWSKIADNYPTAEGRTLDIRDGVMGSGAIEINSVPRFEAKDSKGVIYTKIPRLQFPVDENGVTVLMQDATLYTKDAIYQPLKKSFDNGNTAPSNFQPEASFIPESTTQPTVYDQGPDEMVIDGIENIFKTTMLGKSSYGLKWEKNIKNGMGYFPEYFKKEGDKMVAISSDEVPDETFLKEQNFATAESGKAYTSPSDNGTAWTNPGSKAGPFETTLSDGSIVTYHWYKFIEQPALQALQITESEKNKIQKRIEMIHSSWNSNPEYMAPPSLGKLVTLDKAIIVTPPEGMEIGFVPIVTNQKAAE